MLMSDFHLERQEAFADDFLRGRIDEQQYRARLGRLGFHDYEVDDHVEAVIEEKRERRNKVAFAILITVVGVAAIVWIVSMIPSPIRAVGI